MGHKKKNLVVLNSSDSESSYSPKKGRKSEHRAVVAAQKADRISDGHFNIDTLDGYLDGSIVTTGRGRIIGVLGPGFDF